MFYDLLMMGYIITIDDAPGISTNMDGAMFWMNKETSEICSWAREIGTCISKHFQNNPDGLNNHFMNMLNDDKLRISIFPRNVDSIAAFRKKEFDKLYIY